MVKFLIQEPITEKKSVKEVMRMCGKYSPVVAISGGTQKGKSLLAHEIAYEISKKVFKKKFNYKKNTCLSIDQLVDITAKSKREVIIVEETANQLNKLNFWGADSKDTFFTLISQAFRKNLYLFVQPHLTDVSKSNRLFCNYQFVVSKKYEKTRACFVKPQEIVRVYWDLKGKGFYVKMNAPMLPFYHVYTEDNFKRGKEYTDWLEDVFKDKTLMKNLRLKRGLIKAPEIPLPEPLIM